MSEAKKPKTKTEKRKPGPRFTNAAEQIVRILCRLPRSVREPTVTYATAVAMAAPEPTTSGQPREDAGRNESEQMVLSAL